MEESAMVKDYPSIKKAAREKVAALVGTQVTVTSRKNGCLAWTVVESHSPPVDELTSKASASYGLKDFCFSNYKKSEVLAHIFLELMFQDWRRMVHAMNLAVETSKAKCKKFTNEAFLTGLGLIIGSADFTQKGVNLFGTKKMMIMNFISGPQSVPAHSLSSLWPSAISKTFEGFCPAYLQMKARKRVIPGGSFQVLLNNLI
jgi:hypothetical protein